MRKRRKSNLKFHIFNALWVLTTKLRRYWYRLSRLFVIIRDKQNEIIYVEILFHNILAYKVSGHSIFQHTRSISLYTPTFV